MTSSTAKAAVFASIRESLAASRPFDAVHRIHATFGDLRAVPRDSSSPTDLVELFKENLESVGGKCNLVEDEVAASQRLRDIVERLSAERIVISNSELVRRIADQAGITAIADASRDELFSTDVGITSAQWAIAETGTLVLESGAESHRLVSLVPPVHVCVLRASSIKNSLAEVLEITDPNINRAVTFITGASRTSDIELTLAIGVHGPGELHVILIKDR